MGRLRTRQDRALTRAEIERPGQTWAPSAPPPDGLLAEPPSFGPDVPVRWLSGAGAEALGRTGVAREATLYARLRVGDRPVVHRWTAGDATLEDPWLEKVRPAGARYRPVVPDRVSHHVRRRWVEEVAAELGVEPDQVVVVGWAVVWA